MLLDSAQKTVAVPSKNLGFDKKGILRCHLKGQ